MRYPGGKNAAGTYQKLINLMPPHEVYVEPFLGSGAVMRRKIPAKLNIGIDLDPEIIAASVDIAVNAGGGPLRLVDILSPVASVSILDAPLDGVPHFHFVCAEALDCLSNFTYSGKELIYLDPPYLMETRKSGPLYRFELSAKDHANLLWMIVSLPCMVMISGYWSKLYADTLRKWNSIHFPAMTRGGKMAEEWVWFNYPPPVTLHDYRFLGNTFRDRERLKRRIGRWRARLGRMNELERKALLEAIDEVWAREVHHRDTETPGKP